MICIYLHCLKMQKCVYKKKMEKWLKPECHESCVRVNLSFLVVLTLTLRACSLRKNLQALHEKYARNDSIHFFSTCFVSHGIQFYAKIERLSWNKSHSFYDLLSRPAGCGGRVRVTNSMSDGGDDDLSSTYLKSS